MSFAFNKHRRRGDAGVTSLEVAVIFGVFIVLVFSIIDLSRYLFSQQALTTLVTATARQGFAGTLPAFCNGASLPQTETQVAAFAPLLDFNRITSLAMCVDQGSGVTVLTVTASYSFQPITPLIEAMLGPASTMTATMTYSY